MKHVLIGEAWGMEEEMEGRPFVGSSGRFLHAMLSQVGIREFHLTNVFNLRPKSNDVKTLCTPRRTEGIPGKAPLVPGRNSPTGKGALWVKGTYLGELKRLYNELELLQPECIVCLGATPLWALSNVTGIGAARGNPFFWRGIRCYPTWHPAYILRVYNQKPVFLADLCKARDMAPIPSRTVFVPETFRECEDWVRDHLLTADRLGCDIETRQKQITCIGFAPNIHEAITIPFWTKEGDSYWEDLEEELEVWNLIRFILQIKKVVGQNFTYDTSYLWKIYGMPPLHYEGDTMMQHHSLQPEMRKRLEFLASLYTETPSWKHLRKEDEKELD